MKMLIVDDEEQIREGMRRFVEAQDFGFETVYTAKNGLEGLLLVREHAPDLIVSDVVMPAMDGIQFAKLSKESNRDAQIIMISGHNDVQFLKSAFKFEAVDYILKPIDLLEFQSAVSSARSSIQERLKRSEGLPLQKESLLSDLVYGLRDWTPWLSQRLGGLGVALDSDYYAVRLESDEPRESLDRSEILRLLNESFGESAHTFAENESAFVAILPADRLTKESAVEVCRHAIAALERICLKAYAGVGGKAIGLENVRQSYREAVSALNGRYYSQETRVLTETQTSSPEMPPAFSFTKTFSKQAAGLLLTGDMPELAKEVRARFAELNEKGYSPTRDDVSSLKLQLAKWMTYLAKELEAPATGTNADKVLSLNELNGLKYVDDLSEWIVGKLETLSAALSFPQSGKLTKWVDRMKQAVSDRYDTGLSVQLIGDELSVSPNYLSAVFKRETGTSFTEYLTQYRLKIAIGLMKDPELRLYEICSRVGFEDENYFARVFRKTYGASPSEYREAMR